MQRANRDGLRRDRARHLAAWGRSSVFVVFVGMTVAFVAIAVFARPTLDRFETTTIDESPETTTPQTSITSLVFGCVHPDGTIRVVLGLVQPITRAILASPDLEHIYWHVTADRPQAVGAIDIGTEPPGFTTLTPLDPDQAGLAVLVVHGDSSVTTAAFDVKTGAPFAPCF